MRRPAFALLALVLAVAGGCADQPTAAPDPTGTPSRPDTAAPGSPLTTCEGLATPPPEAGAPPGPTAAPRPGAGLPAITLACFTGGAPFPLAELRGPAVVNLWASWCAPCREELPHLQRLADQAAGQVHVLGVVTEDRPDAAGSLAEALDISFPAVDDPDRKLLRAIEAVGLPATLYLTATGEIAHVHQGPGLDEPALRAQVSEHLEVRVGGSG